MAEQQGKRALVIVESPSKAKTIQGYLGKGFEVDSSRGHVRDLPGGADQVPAQFKGEPWARLGINVDEGFEPIYVVQPSSKKTINELKAKLKEVDVLYLATDEDREGEAIAWHLREILKPKVPTYRMVFNEVTKEAILAAVENTREINQDLVDAQEARRLLDRIYGFEVSPVLWRKVKSQLSAGRVQSVALRLIVDRERERMAFTSANYWSVEAICDPGEFPARLAAIDGDRVAQGSDFSDQGVLTRKGAVHLDQASAQELVAALADANLTVSSIERKPLTRKPRAPFITSTLQQEAARKLRWSAQRTMSVAQGLYENGFITYMRTDSTTLSQTAVAAARKQAEQLYGSDHVSPAPRVYASKVKNAQEAHEAIRPAGSEFQTPAQVASQLNHDEFALYDLIWKRTLASQMADAKLATTTIRMETTATDGRHVEFTASGTVVTFPGHLAAYEEGDDKDESKSNKASEAKDVRLPSLSEGDRITLASLLPEGHDTKPPARFTEASLVKQLEEKSIGRPSTYADIMRRLLYKDYIYKRGTALVPTWVAFAVIRLMENHFGTMVDYDFTADLEDVLDTVSLGQATRNDVLHDFYFGTTGSPHTNGQPFRGVHELARALDEIDARENASFPIEGTQAILRVGKYGPYLDVAGQIVNIPEDLAPDELTALKVQELLDAPSGDFVLGNDPATGHQIVAKAGRYGPYVTEVLPDPEEAAAASELAGNEADSAAGASETSSSAAASEPATKSKPKKAKKPKKVKPRTASLFKDMAIDTITLADALQLLQLPRVVGEHPEDGKEVIARNGRFGPYMTWGDETRSLPDEPSLLTVTLDQAVEIFKQPKQRRGRQAAAGTEIGEDPATGAKIMLKSGRFGPYVTDGTTNASVPRGEDPKDVDLQRAADLLAERRLKAPPKKAAKKTAKKTAKKAAKKAPAKKTAKKAPAKKAPAKKAAAKRTVKKAVASK